MCAPLSPPNNGTVSYTTSVINGTYPVSTGAIYDCEPPWPKQRINGSFYNKCEQSGNWRKSTTPTCEIGR